MVKKKSDTTKTKSNGKTPTTKKKQRVRRVKKRIVEEYYDDGPNHVEEEFGHVTDELNDTDEFDGEDINDTSTNNESRTVKLGSEFFSSSHIKHVGFWKRTFAYLIDLVCTFVVIPFFTNLYTSPVKGWTLGKYLLGIRVVDEKTLKPKGYVGDIFIRGIVGKGLIGMLTIGIGYLWIAFDKKKQGFHDKIAGTIVVYKKDVK